MREGNLEEALKNDIKIFELSDNSQNGKNAIFTDIYKRESFVKYKDNQNINDKDEILSRHPKFNQIITDTSNKATEYTDLYYWNYKILPEDFNFINDL